jgi:CyaY protein
MWLAGRAGGYHFRQAADGRWVDTRDGGEFFTRLAELLAAQGGESLVF